MRTQARIDKDIIRTCPVVGAAARHVAAADADAVPDNALRDPGRDVTPNGTPYCKNADSHVRAAPRTICSNPAEHTADTRNFRQPALPDDPRARPIRQLASPSSSQRAWLASWPWLTPPWRTLLSAYESPQVSVPWQMAPILLVMVLLIKVPVPLVLAPVLVTRVLWVKVLDLLRMVLVGLARAIHAAVAAAPAPVVPPGRVRWPDNAGFPAGSANAELPADRRACNNVPAGTLARTAVHILLEDTNVRHAVWAVAANPAEVGFPLAVRSTVFENDWGPREFSTPDDQVSERSVNFVPRRFVQLLVTTFPLSYPAIQCAALAPPTARFWPPGRARVTLLAAKLRDAATPTSPGARRCRRTHSETAETLLSSCAADVARRSSATGRLRRRRRFGLLGPGVLRRGR